MNSSQLNKININGHQYTKVLIIENVDIHAGMSALILYALNGMRYAEKHNFLPIINYNHTNCPHFYDANYGDDIWSYFFEPPSGLSFRDFLEMSIVPELIEKRSAKEIMYEHHFDPDRIATFWAWDKPKDVQLWMKIKRELGRQTFNHIRVHDSIIEKANSFWRGIDSTLYIIGVHVRGTDFAYAEPTPLKKYFDEIETIINSRAIGNFQIFIATDQQQYVENARERYGEKVIHYEAIRSDSAVAPFKMNNVSGFQKGADVIVDMILLSRCDFLIKSVSAVGELALWMNPDLRFKDLSVHHNFVEKPYYNLRSAFNTLNVGAKKFEILRIIRIREIFSNYFKSVYPFDKMYRGYIRFKSNYTNKYRF